jgi:hypothetical protein
MVRVMAEITEKSRESTITSLDIIFTGGNDFSRKPEAAKRILNIISKKTYLYICLILTISL